MKIYQDIFNDEEILTDALKFEEDFDGVIYRVKTVMVPADDTVDVDVGCGNAFGGKNEDDEEGGDAGNKESQVYKIPNVVKNHNLVETQFDKAGFQAYFKGYMKKLLDQITKSKPDRVDAFKKGAMAYFKWVLSRFDDFSYYCPTSYDVENMIILAYWVHEDDEAPTFVYMADGLKFFKV
jgi:hypothetical protein